MVAAADLWPDFLRNEAGALLCSYLAERGGGALGAFAGGAVGGLFGGAGGIPGRAAGGVIGSAAGSALGALWCPTTPPTSGEFPLTPESSPIGNCDGVRYSGTIEYERNDGLIQIAGTGFLWGPVGRFVIQPVNSGTGTIIFISCRGSGNGPIQAPGTLVPLVDSPSEIYTRATLLTLGREDGQPDNCPAPNSDPNFPAVPDDVPPLSRDPAARRSIDVDVEFGDTTINIGGELSIDGPNIGPGGLEVCFNFDGLIFCIDPFGGLRIGPGSRQDNPDNPEDPPPPPGDDNRRVLKGVFYQATEIADNQSFDLTSGDNYFYPRFGSVQFTGQEKKSEHFAMNALNGFIPNPLESVFDDYVFTPYKGPNRARFSPVWDALCCVPTAGASEGE